MSNTYNATGLYNSDGSVTFYGDTGGAGSGGSAVTESVTVTASSDTYRSILNKLKSAMDFSKVTNDASIIGSNGFVAHLIAKKSDRLIFAIPGDMAQTKYIIFSTSSASVAQSATYADGTNTDISSTSVSDGTWTLYYDNIYTNEIDLSDYAKQKELSNLVLTGTTNASGATIANGTCFVLNGDFVTAKTTIASGATFTLNTNYEKKSVGEVLKELNGNQAKDISFEGTGSAKRLVFGKPIPNINLQSWGGALGAYVRFRITCPFLMFKYFEIAYNGTLGEYDVLLMDAPGTGAYKNALSIVSQNGISGSPYKNRIWIYRDVSDGFWDVFFDTGNYWLYSITNIRPFEAYDVYENPTISLDGVQTLPTTSSSYIEAVFS